MKAVFTIDEPVRAVLQSICRRNHVRQLSLFGSATAGPLRPESDLDFLVEFEPAARVGLLSFLWLQEELARLFGRQVDLVPKNGLKPMIRDRVLSESQVVYAG